MKEKGLYYGNDYDATIIRSIPKMYGQYLPNSLKGKTVLDIGGHIGSFAVYAARKKAKKVITIEPLPRNIKLLLKNTKKYPNVKVLKGAVVRYLDVDRFITSSGMKTKNPKANFGHNRVFDKPTTRTWCKKIDKLYNFQDLLVKYKPHILKIDCEGSEHEFLNGFIYYKFVEMILLEVHFYNNEQKENWPALLRNLLSSFDIVAGKERAIQAIAKTGVIILKRKEIQ